jgi:transcriptional regulator with XRE-family HTH domain
MTSCRFRQEFPSLSVAVIRYCEFDCHQVFASIFMSSPQLPNYLRANRKRLALSQDEVAFLLGTRSGAKVCRYERFVREPSLETALAFEVIFKRSVSELFSGLYQQTERDVAKRAKMLVERKGLKANQQSVRKHEALAGLATAQSTS